VQLPEERTPILYMPGVGRGDLRAIASCPEHLMPLAELQYRGCWWVYNSMIRDWTVQAFLVSANGGVGLDVASDPKTREAMLLALAEILNSNRSDLAGRRLEAVDFNRLVSTDPVRDLLFWMNDPQGAQKEWNKARWQAFTGSWKSEYKFSPEKEGELAAAELLCLGQGQWQSVWQRYTESWKLYPGIKGLLMRVDADLGASGSSYPVINCKQEKELEADLVKLQGLNGTQVRKRLIELDKHHCSRRDWIWCEQGLASLAGVLEHLADIARQTELSFSGTDPEAMALQYREKYWQVDDSALKAMAFSLSPKHKRLVRALLNIIYTPWLNEAVNNF